MKGLILLVLFLAAAGCLMQPYGKGNATANATKGADSNVTKMLNRTCDGPVCGADGNTYNTDCAAEAEGVAVASQGACAVCNDSDGGVLSPIVGTVTKGGEAHTDYCINGTAVQEYACLENSIVMVPIPCDDIQGRVCEAGKCVILEPPEPEGNETGGEEENATANETGNETLEATGCHGPDAPDFKVRETTVFNGKEYNDTCADYRTVKDYYCKNDNLTSQNNQCDSGSICSNGKCFEPELVCTEDDAGNDTSVRSTTQVMRGLSILYNKIDECIDDGMLTEHYCLENGSAASEEVLCPSGKKCVSGRCVKSLCKDSDGGINIFVNGTAVSRGSEYNDTCIDDMHIEEQYCYGDDVESTSMDCGKGYVCDEYRGVARCIED